MKKLLVLIAFLPIAACSNGNGGQEDKFSYPEVTFMNEAAGTSGWATYNRLVPDPAALIKQQCLEVVKTLYSSTSDPNIPRITQIHYIFTSGVEVSDVSVVIGQPNARRIRYSPTNVEQWAPGGDSKVMLEVKGVLNHELTHVYQLNPQGAGGYAQGTEHWAFVEGMADAVRPVLGPFADGRKPMKGGSYMDGYSTTGWFLVWLKDTKDPDFLRKFNGTAATINPWSWDAAMQNIFGQGITAQGLWNEYQESFDD